MEKVEQVNNYKYLGIIIEKKWKNAQKINEKIKNTSKTFNAFENTFLEKKE